MKNLRLLYLFILLISLLISCDQSGEMNVTRIIKNSTDHVISIEVYFNGSVIENKFLEEFDSDSVKVKCSTDHSGSIVGSTCHPFIYWGDSDSVLVTFDNSRFIRYCRDFLTNVDCGVNGKNIMIFPQDDGYQRVNGNQYLFEITEDDYALAIAL